MCFTGKIPTDVSLPTSRHSTGGLGEAAWTMELGDGQSRMLSVEVALREVG